MAMLIACRRSTPFAGPAATLHRGFLIVTPGLTIRDRLRVLQPNDPDSYYSTRDLIPVIWSRTSEGADRHHQLHAFKRRERLELSAGGRALLEGATGPELQTLEQKDRCSSE